MAFDVLGARQAGYSDTEIADFLASQNIFDTTGARKSGYSDTEIVDFAAGPKEKSFLGDVSESLSKRAENVGDIFTTNRPPEEGFMGFVNKIPERALQVTGQGAGFVNDVAFSGLRAAYRALMPEKAQEAIASGAKSVMEMPAIQEGVKAVSDVYEGAKERYPEGMRNIEAVANIAGAIPILKGASIAKQEGVNIAKDVTKIATELGEEAFNNRLNATIRAGVEKAIRPSVAGKGSAAQMDRYFEDASSAVKNIISNKENLALTDFEGNVTKGVLPKTLKQFSEATDQTKRSIFKQYDDLAKQAGDEGATINLDSVVTALENDAKDIVTQDLSPSIANYAMKKAATFKERGIYTAEQAQDAIARLNKSLEAFYKNPSPQAMNKARIDAIIVQNLRKSLDDAIENAVGPGYQELKNAYGSLKAIEKDVAHRTMIDARKNIKGLVDFADIFTSGELLAGIATMNPHMVVRAGAWKAVKEYFKMLNNPNRIVKDMFGGVDKLITKRKEGFKSHTVKAVEEYFNPPGIPPGERPLL